MNIHFKLEHSSRASSPIRKKYPYQTHIESSASLDKHSHPGGRKTLDPKVLKIRKNHPIAAEYNGILQAKIKELNGVYSKLLQDAPSTTGDDVIRHLKRTPKPTSLALQKPQRWLKKKAQQHGNR